MHEGRNRLLLLGLVALFLAPLGAALLLRFSGWEPASTRNFGELLQPPVDLRDLTLETLDGEPFAWQPQRRVWSVLVAAPRDCAARCEELLDDLHRVWLSEGRHADRLRVLWLGRAPAPRFPAVHMLRDSAALRARLPAPLADTRGIAVHLVDPSGFLVLRHAPGFDAGELRKDLGRLIR